jgi:peptide/nickel transport system substrate-binding protein
MLSWFQVTPARTVPRLGVGLIAALMLLTACGQTTSGPNPAPSGQSEPPAQQANQPKKGGTLLLLGHHEVAGMSPQDDGPTVHWSVITQVHNALVENDHNYVLENVLAEDYSISPDGKTITFNLRKGVKFHDGTEFTAKDVKHTYDFYRDPANKTVIASRFGQVASVEEVDKHTVRVNLKEPDATFMLLAATTFIVNADYHKKVGEDKYRTAPIGTGAFKLKEWRANEYTLLEAFPDHFRGRPNLDFVRLNVVPEASVRAVALQTSQAHSSVWPMLTEDNLKLAQDDKFKTFRTPSTSVNHFPLNNTHYFLSDKKVRQAMMHAIDRQRVIDDVFKGAAQIAHSNLAPAFARWNEPGVKKYDFNVEKSKQLLDEAGWKVGTDGIREKDGKKAAFTITVISGDQARKPEAEFVQQGLKEVGIKVEIREAPTATILAQLPKGEMDASLFNWTYGGTGGEPDPYVTLHSKGARNFSVYQNPKVDALIEQGKRETDVAKRKAIYSEIQMIVAEDTPFLMMMYWDWFNSFSNKVKGLPDKATNGSALYRMAYKWWLD